MALILRKFPQSVAEKWQEFLSRRSVAEKSQKEIWERMMASEIGKNSSPGRNLCHYGAERGNGGVTEERECFLCGEVGHLQGNCLKKM